MAEAYERMLEIPPEERYRPEGSWTRSEFSAKYNLTRAVAHRKIHIMLENGVIEELEQRSTSGAKYYRTIKKK